MLLQIKWFALPDYFLLFKSAGSWPGSLATGTPTASKAAIFSAAVPDPLEMMAPACPICLPGGACCPAMKAATGLVT